MKKLGLISLALVAALFLAVSAMAATKTFTKPMTGKAETPKGSPTGKGSATITVNTSTGQVCFKLSWSGIGTPTASHIHKDNKGVAGPVVLPLFSSPKHSGCVKASKSLAKAIVKTPAAYYVNIHTAKFPGGAIRTQL